MNIKFWIKNIITCFTVLFLFCLLIRIIEFNILPDTLAHISINTTSLLIGIIKDVVFISLFSIIIGSIFIIKWKYNRLTKIFGLMLMTKILLIQIGLVVYFCIMKENLGSSIFLLTSNEIITILGNEKIKISLFIISIFGIFLTTKFLYNLLIKKLEHTYLISVFSSIFFVSLLINFISLKKCNEYEKNRLNAFLISSFKGYNIRNNIDANISPKDFKNLTAKFFDNRPFQKNYPIFHPIKDEDYLSKELKKLYQKPPNIVIMMIESLSTDLVGHYGHKTGKLMPFLDSLSKQSLYFPNFLSTAERTHNVLPASLASLPNAPEGYNMMNLEYPNQYSITNLLKRKYISRFYCGVDLHYFRMLDYMNFLQTDCVEHKWDVKISDPTVENEWGEMDGKIFQQSHLDLERLNTNKPILDMFLTISTHHPFIIPNQDKYIDLVKKRISKSGRITPYKSKILELSKEFSTFTYLDEKLKNYFNTWKKKKDFNNTIFFIYGDHGFEHCINHNIDKYRIPLIVYSPNIKNPKINFDYYSQLDIAPTIFQFLRKNYFPELPNKVPFVGKNLKFNTTNRNNRVFIFNSLEFINNAALWSNYFYHNNELFYINSDKSLSPSNKSKSWISNQLKLYNLFSNYVTFENKILPHSEYKKNVPFKSFQTIKNKKFYTKHLKTKDQIIDIGNNITWKNKWKKIKIDVSLKAKFKTKKDIANFITVTTSCENLLKDSNDLVFWFSQKFIQKEKFKKNTWIKMETKLTIETKNLLKQIINHNVFKYYLLNINNNPIRIKDVNVHLSYTN